MGRGLRKYRNLPLFCPPRRWMLEELTLHQPSLERREREKGRIGSSGREEVSEKRGKNDGGRQNTVIIGHCDSRILWTIAYYRVDTVTNRLPRCLYHSLAVSQYLIITVRRSRRRRKRGDLEWKQSALVADCWWSWSRRKKHSWLLSRERWELEISHLYYRQVMTYRQPN